MASTADVTAPGSFGIADLGRVQFDRLCVALLTVGSELPDHAFEPGLPGERVVVVRAGVRLPFAQRQLPGPTVVMPVWVAGGDDVLDPLVDPIAREASLLPTPASFLVLTNAPGRWPPVIQGRPLVVLGPAELGAVVRRGRRACFALPWLAGLHEASGILDGDAVARSTGDVAGALELAAVFVATDAYARALAAVQQHGFTVLSGPPEMGKTAIARMLGLAALTAGYELHECTRPDELFARLDADRAQVFVADDAFGSTEYRPDAAERWALHLDRALRAMDERHWLIWTARPGPLHAALARIHREHGVERFPQPAGVHVDASALTVTEKALILFRHARAAQLPDSTRDALRVTGPRIVAHPLLTPERIRRLVRRGLSVLLPRGGASFEAIVEREIREPTEAMAASYDALDPALRAVLVALVDAPDGAVPERVVAAGARRHGDGGIPRPIGALLDGLADHFVRRVEQNAVTWVHPSLRDLVIDALATDPDARPRFLRAASIEGLLLALSTAGGARGERTRPLLVADADFDAAADRIAALTSDLADEDAARLLRSLREAVAARRPGELISSVVAGAPARTRAELVALAELALRRLRARLDDAIVDVDLRLLEAWLELAAVVDHADPIDVTALWMLLSPLPGTDLADPAEARRADDWTRLAAALVRHPTAATPGIDRRALASSVQVIRFAVVLQAELEDPPPTLPLLVSALTRLTSAMGVAPPADVQQLLATAFDERALERAPTPWSPHWDELGDRTIVDIVLADL